MFGYVLHNNVMFLSNKCICTDAQCLEQVQFTPVEELSMSTYDYNKVKDCRFANQLFHRPTCFWYTFVYVYVSSPLVNIIGALPPDVY